MLRSLLGNGDRFVVVDVETTGVYQHDRVVEVAAVTVDRHGEIVDEWDTLVDPQRDVGPTHIHGVTATMVSAAPRFEEVAAALAERLYGAVVVAHNLTFDTRMLVNEFARLDATLAPGDGLCTLRIGGGKLADLCYAYGVKLTHAHRALGDARVTAQLLARVLDGHTAACSCARVFDVRGTYQARTLQREMIDPDDVPMPYLARLGSNVHHYGEQGAALAYLDLLDWALADLVISPEEQSQLLALAADLGLSRDEVTDLHGRYLDELVAAALRDDVVSDAEASLLHRAAAALDISPGAVDQRVDGWRSDSGGLRLVPGMRVCFTGTATYPDGSELPRRKLQQVAESLDLVATSSVTKSSCDVLVAADTSTQSGKAGKARRYCIPIVDVYDFVRAQPDSSVPVMV